MKKISLLVFPIGFNGLVLALHFTTPVNPNKAADHKTKILQACELLAGKKHDSPEDSVALATIADICRDVPHQIILVQINECQVSMLD